MHVKWATMKIHHIVSIVYYVCPWYCSCHRPYKVVALSIDLLACLYLCRVLWHLDFLNLNFLKNALDENDFISTGTIVNRSFVKCCLLKVILLNNCDIYCFVQIAVATHFYEIKDSFESAFA